MQFNLHAADEKATLFGRHEGLMRLLPYYRIARQGLMRINHYMKHSVKAIEHTN